MVSQYLHLHIFAVLDFSPRVHHPGRNPIQDPTGFSRILQDPVSSHRILPGILNGNNSNHVLQDLLRILQILLGSCSRLSRVLFRILQDLVQDPVGSLILQDLEQDPTGCQQDPTESYVGSYQDPGWDPTRSCQEPIRILDRISTRAYCEAVFRQSSFHMRYKWCLIDINLFPVYFEVLVAVKMMVNAQWQKLCNWTVLVTWMLSCAVIDLLECKNCKRWQSC